MEIKMQFVDKVTVEDLERMPPSQMKCHEAAITKMFVDRFTDIWWKYRGFVCNRNNLDLLNSELRQDKLLNMIIDNYCGTDMLEFHGCCKKKPRVSIYYAFDGGRDAIPYFGCCDRTKIPLDKGERLFNIFDQWIGSVIGINVNGKRCFLIPESKVIK